MIAANSLQSPAPPGAEKRPYEPSMEEILASIRRIIADDHSLPSRMSEQVAPGRQDDAERLAREPVTSLLDDEPSLRSDRSLLGDEAARRDSSPASPLHREPKVADVIVTIEREATSAPVRESPSMLGTITAPQFASPAGPHAARPAEQATLEPTSDEGPESEAPVDFAGPGNVDPVDAARDLEPESDGGLESDGEPGHDEAVGTKRDRDLLDHEARLRDLEEEIRDSEQESSRRRDLTATPDALFSASTDHSVTAAFNALAATRLADNSEELLGIAREMIRPLLKAWIDDNMPGMVERMIRAEIERVARGGR